MNKSFIVIPFFLATVFSPFNLGTKANSIYRSGSGYEDPKTSRYWERDRDMVMGNMVVVTI